MTTTTLNPAALAALFLILTVFTATIHTPSRGFPVGIARRGSLDCGDGREVVLNVIGNGELRLSTENLKLNELDNRLQEIFKTRAERVLFVTGDPDVPFQKVADAIDTARKHVNHVALVTASVRRLQGNCFIINPPPPEIALPAGYPRFDH